MAKAGALAGSTAGMETAMHGTAQVGPLRRPHQHQDRDALRLWGTGRGLLTFHVSLFLSGIVVLFLFNLATAPADLWVENAAWLWAVLLVIHALTVVLLQLIALLRGDTTASVFGAPRAGSHASARDFRAPPPTALTATAGADGNSTATFANWPHSADESPQPVPAALPVAGTWSEWLPTGNATGEPASPWSNGEYVSTHDPLPAPPMPERVSWEEAAVGAWLSRRGHHGDQADQGASQPNGRVAPNGQTDHI